MNPPKAPPAPDPYATAKAQADANVETAIGNTYMQNANETSPYGNVTYTKRGTETVGGREVPLFDRAVTLSPEQQTLLDQQNSLSSKMNTIAGDELGRLSTTLASPIGQNLPSVDPIPSYSRDPGPSINGLQSTISLGRASAPGAGLQRSVSLDRSGTQFGDAGTIQRSIGDGSRASTSFGNAGAVSDTFADAGGVQRAIGPNDFSADRTRVESALMERLNPLLERDRSALETQLVNQGLTRGTAAFNAAMDEASRSATDARLAVVGAAGQEQERLFGMDATRGQFANAAQAQEFGQARDRGVFAQGAQAQRFGQEQTKGQFSNDAIAQNLSGDLARGQFANAAQAQSFGQEQDRGLFAQGAVQQNNAATLNEGQFQNDNYWRDYEASQGALQYNNAATQDEATFRNATYAQQLGAQQDALRYNNQIASQEYAERGTARERALQEQLALRNQPINQISALMNGGQVTAPQFSPFKSTGYEPAPIANSVYQSAQLAQDQWKTRTQAQAQTMGSIFGLGSSLATFGASKVSDRRLKRGIRPLGVRLLNGLSLYAYRLVGTDAPQVGVMADEVAMVRPDAVAIAADGFARVDYARIV